MSNQLVELPGSHRRSFGTPTGDVGPDETVDVTLVLRQGHVDRLVRAQDRKSTRLNSSH